MSKNKKCLFFHGESKNLYITHTQKFALLAGTFSLHASLASLSAPKGHYSDSCASRYKVVLQ